MRAHHWVLLAACSTSDAAGPQEVKVKLADVGLEASSLDKTADPCVDFYQHACGGWLAANKIPDDKARYGRFTEIDERIKTQLKTVLDEATKATDPATKKLGDFYASCMDEAAIDRAGTRSIKPLLDLAAKIKDAKSWMAALTELHQSGVRVVWRASSGADLKDSTTSVTQLDAAGLGLPDREYYFDDKYKDKLDAYKVHVGKMLDLAGIAKPDAAATDVVAIETEMARTMKNATERRDIQKAYNPTDLKGLAKQASSVDWPAYFKALGVEPSTTIVIGTPAYFQQLDKLRGKFKPAQWTSYFTYHLVDVAAFGIGKKFDDEAFELDKAMTGVVKREDRFKRCIDTTSRSLGELLGQVYAAKYFPPTAKQSATALVDAIVKAMGDEMGTLAWMSADTKKIAQAKLGKVVRMIGYPDKWRTYDFDIKRDDFAGNELRASAFEFHRMLAKSGKPVDRGEWSMNTYEVNAYYRPTANNTALPAGILQAPFFGADRAVAVNLGGIGMVIGHELTHGFDDQGAQFDADGNLKNWWTKDDKTAFDTKTTCVADQYSGFEALPKQDINGKLTLGENVADLGGVKMAFRAYRALRAGAAKTYVADGYTEDQQFFLAVGQAWCGKDRPEETQRRLAVDPHSPPKFRVYGALRNMSEFAEAFKCAEGTPMRPANTCSVW